jgi:hypothetical protein
LDLKRYATAERIPIRWILYDSWFYAKANGSATGSGMMSPSHAALNWSDADPAVFPSGLRAMYRATGWPVVAHARAWASAKVSVPSLRPPFSLSLSLSLSLSRAVGPLPPLLSPLCKAGLTGSSLYNACS